MGNSKKQTEFERIEALGSSYKKFSDRQLIAFINRASLHTEEKYRIAVSNEIKRRGLKID